MTPRELALALAATTVVADAAKERKDELRDLLLSALDSLGADSAAASLPDGTTVAKTSIVAPDAQAKVADEAAYSAHIADSYPTEVQTLVIVRESFSKHYLSTLVQGPDGEAVDPDTGEIVPGVKFANRSPYVSTRFTKDGRAAIVDAIRSGQIPLELTAATPALEQK